MTKTGIELSDNTTCLPEKVRSIIRECSSEDELQDRLNAERITFYLIDWVSDEDSNNEEYFPAFELYSYTKAKSGNRVKVQHE